MGSNSFDHDAFSPCRRKLVPCWPAFRFIGLNWPGLAPAGDLLSCVAKKEGKEGDPCLTGRPLCGRLPCAARSRRPSRNSPAAPAQTAAPDFPACSCAARRFGTGFGGGTEPFLKLRCSWYSRLVRHLPSSDRLSFPPLTRRVEGGTGGSGLRMFEPAGRVCADPARHARSSGTPAGGAAAGHVSLHPFLSCNKKGCRPPGRDPANAKLTNRKADFCAAKRRFS